MNFTNGFYDLPPEKLATIVTALEMHEKPALPPHEDNPGWALVEKNQPDTEWYRDLYRRIGEEWLWFSRAVMQDGELSKIISDPKVVIYALEIEGNAEGLLELDYRSENECELAFLGVTDKIIGNGAGKWLMNHAIDIAWNNNKIDRLWIHTCTLDHPRALPFYIRSGFKPYMRQLEIADDPRISGAFPPKSSGHFPVLNT